MEAKPVTLLQLNKYVASLVMTPETQNVWVTAELSDVAVRGGHCYMELLQKNESTGATEAKARAAIWANVYVRIRTEFLHATGQEFASGMKVMVRASVSMHPVYGLSLVVNAVNPAYTMGDLIRRRNEMLARLKTAGLIDLNRSLQWENPLLRIAIISAEGAAGYGDFMNQLGANPMRLRFTTKLFPAIMQGERAAASVMSALDAVNADIGNWDCVVIIRGGGATSDLMGFENYDLAANVAQFPLPVIVGIGHERDVTILDYVACIRVKTPTAAAEWLLAKGKELIDELERLSLEIHRAVTDRISGCKEQLGIIEGRLPGLPQAVIERASARLDRCTLGLQKISSVRILPQLAKMQSIETSIAVALPNIIKRHEVKLDNIGTLIEMLSPAATLKRGYSITRYNGRAVTSPDEIPQGAAIVTTVAHGTINSIKQ